MNRTEHKEFAMSRGITSAEYDSMNAKWEAHNAAIRAARAKYEAAATDSPEQEAAGKALDEAIAAPW